LVPRLDPEKPYRDVCKDQTCDTAMYFAVQAIEKTTLNHKNRAGYCGQSPGRRLWLQAVA